MEAPDILESTQPILLTPDGHARLRAELNRLTVDKRAEIAERLRASKDHGEFSEDNNELDEVKQQQAIVENRIGELKAILQNADIITPEMVSTDYVGLGSKVTVKEASRSIEFQVQVVAGVEADPDRDLISEESPMGTALMGRSAGELAEFVAPIGLVRYEILKIEK
jgi:transcription elongation factor GreA